MKSAVNTRDESRFFARRILALGCLLPLVNCVSAAALGILVVFSDADNYQVLTGILSAANVGGWLWWLTGSIGQFRAAVTKWTSHPEPQHPGFCLAGLVSLGGALGWVGVLCLLAYGMLG